MATGNVIAYVPSSSNPSVSYEVRLGKDGNVYCTCPNWKFQKLPPKERTCKHMKALSGQIASVTAKLAKAPVAQPVAKKAPAKAAVVAQAAAPAPVAVTVTEDAQIAALEAQLAALKATKAQKLAAAQAKVDAAKAALAAAEAELKQVA